MATTKPRVLLIGENSQGSSHLIRRLEKQECECCCATTYSEVCSLLDAQEFDLVLSPLRLCGSRLFSLMERLANSRTTLLYFQPVEEGCWWLPALLCGRNCYGSNALCPSEFVILLEEIIDKIKAGTTDSWQTSIVASVAPKPVLMFPSPGKTSAGAKPLHANASDVGMIKVSG